MKPYRQTCLFFVFLFVVNLPAPCAAWVTESNRPCTWGIANSDLSIPDGCIPVGAVLVLHNLYADPAFAQPSLSIYLLQNLEEGAISLAQATAENPFEEHGTCLGRYADLISFDGADVTIDLGRIDDAQSWVWSVYGRPFSQTLGNGSTAAYSSALLELLDCCGSSRSFGFGFWPQGIDFSGMTLELTIQSMTAASGPQVLTYSYGDIHAPQMEALPDYSITSGQTLSFSIEASDLDGDALVYWADNLPDGASFAGQTFTWTPDPTQEGTWPVLFGVSDGTLAVTQTAAITVNAAPVNWIQILYDDFEAGFGNWIDGGTHCLRSTKAAYAHQGIAALDLQDDTNTSVATTANLDLAGRREIKVDFWYLCISMDKTTEDFWLQISTDGGSSFTTVEEWNRGDEFVNGRFYQESVIIAGYTLTNQTRIRFRCDAGGKDDDVFIDQITVSVR